MTTTFKVDLTEFHRTRLQYMNYTKRDLADVLNTKAFFIARGAARLTPRVSAAKIAGEFGEAWEMRKSKRPRPGKQFVKGKLMLQAKIGEMVRLAVIINARRAKKGMAGLEGSAMEKAVRKVYAARQKSRAFLASGWLGAIAVLDAIVSNRKGAPPRDSSIKRIGRMKGGATIARPFWFTKAKIWNSASTTRDRKQALVKYGQPALQQAVDNEVSSMKQYIEEKLKDRLRKLGIKFIST